jgi:hypothetical protein
MAAGDMPLSPAAAVGSATLPHADTAEVSRTLFQSGLRDGPEFWQHTTEIQSDVDVDSQVQPPLPSFPTHISRSDSKPHAEPSFSDASVALSPLFAEDGRKPHAGNVETFVDVELTPLSPEHALGRSDRGFSAAMELQDVVQDLASRPYTGFLTRIAPALSQVTQASAAAAKQLQESAASFRSHLIEGQYSEDARADEHEDLNVSDSSQLQQRIPDRGLFSSLFNTVATSILAGQNNGNIEVEARPPHTDATAGLPECNGYVSSPKHDGRYADAAERTSIQPPPATLAWSLTAHQQAFEHHVQHDHYNHATAFHLTTERMEPAPESMPQFVAPGRVPPPTTIGWVAASGTSKAEPSLAPPQPDQDTQVDSWPEPFGHVQPQGPVDFGAGSLPVQADAFFSSAKHGPHSAVVSDTFSQAPTFSSPNTMKSWF